jgi:hypothetical protein
VSVEVRRELRRDVARVVIAEQPRPIDQTDIVLAFKAWARQNLDPRKFDIEGDGAILRGEE